MHITLSSSFWKWPRNMTLNKSLSDPSVHWATVGNGILIRVLPMVLRDNNNALNGTLNGTVVL